MYVGISQNSSGDSECICISLVVAVVEIYSSDKKEIDSLIPVLQTMCAHVLNKHLKNKDSEVKTAQGFGQSGFFLFVAFSKISRHTKISRILSLSIVRVKIFEEGI